MNSKTNLPIASLAAHLRRALVAVAILPTVVTVMLYRQQSTGEQAELLSWSFLLTTVAAYGAVVALVWWVPRLVNKPIQQWSQTLSSVQAGRLNATLPDVPYREFAQLGEPLQALLETLQEMVEEANQTADRVSSVQQEIVHSCNQQVSGAHEQSQAVSETSSAAAELSRSSEQIGANIQNISQMADHVLAGMEKIKVATDQTNRILTSLNEKSKQIGHITELIDDVADQTNLLAVNASIEAARAGEQGRGFTVVADQISKLADSTGKSTKDITALVEIIQHEMSNAIIAMEQSLVGVEEEIQLTKDSASKSREIAMNANQQISGSRQIAEAMVRIDQTMKQIVTDAQQAASQAGALSGVSEELRACTRQYQPSNSGYENTQEIPSYSTEAEV